MDREGTPDPTGNGIDPNAPPKAGGGSTEPRSGFTPYKIKVRGQEMIVDSMEKAVELSQKGAAFERNQAKLKEDLRQREEEYNEKLRQLQPLLSLDERLRTEPELATRVNAVLAGNPIPDTDDGQTDDPYLREIDGLKRQMRRLEQGITRDMGGVRRDVEETRRDRAYEREETYIKKHWDWASDDDLDQARALAEKKGIDLVTAFKATAFDELPERVRRDTFQEFGLDEARLAPARSEALTLEGFGPIDDPKKMAELYDDPDRYARFKPQLREMRRIRSGKREYIR